MDNRQNHADESGGVVVMAEKVVTNVKDLAASVRNKAKAKKAQKISDAGGYLTLTPFQKSLIDVPDYILNDARETGTDLNDIKNAPAMLNFQNTLPYIIGGVVLLVVVYFIFRK